MKEKIKKAFKNVTFNLVFAWFNLAMFGYLIFATWSIMDLAVLAFLLPFLLISMQAFELHSLGKKRNKDREVAILASLSCLRLFDNLERYKKLYGELPEEEKQEPEESEN